MRAVSSGRGPSLAIACGATLLGISAALRYHALGLTLSHYDARGHLVVARRIIDSLTPGWQQIGAVWLPLPHLLAALPIQVDSLYRTGAASVAMSIACFATATTAIAWLVARATGSWVAAGAATLVFALNPNVVYLQATPMTEPLLIALSVVSIAGLVDYCDSRTAAFPRVAHVGAALSPAALGGLFAAACLTRYEAWPVTIGALVAAPWCLWRRGTTPAQAARDIGRVAVYPLAAIAGFTVFSRVVVGSWFANDFFVPENPAEGRPLEAVRLIVWGLHQLSGTGVSVFAAVGLVLATMRALTSRAHATLILPLALLGTAAVPWSAFVDGHPYRIRYMVPLIAVQAFCAGIAAGSFTRLRWPASVGLVVVTLFELNPLSTRAPMVLEAQWDAPNFALRDRVMACLKAGYRGETVMVSMGSLGHYMQNLAAAGFALRDFLHEGNGDIWLNALNAPRPYVGWILIEEKAEGGDMLARMARERPAFLHGYVRVCDGAGLALYRREPGAPTQR